ncbi:MAG: sensor histidine kinase [Acidobacteriota bacterium]
MNTDMKSGSRIPTRAYLAALIILAALPSFFIILHSVRHHMEDSPEGLWTDLGLMIAATLLALCAALALGEAWIIRPLRAISLAAKRIAQGELEVRARVGMAPWELAGLGQTFDSMALALKRRDERTRKVLEELRASRKRFKDIAWSMSDWIWEMDAQGGFTFSSGQVQGIMGYEPGEILGKHFTDFFPEGEHHEVRTLFESVARTLRPITDFEAWHVTRDGRRVCLRTSGRPMRDAQGRFTGIRGVCRDVTRQKLAQEHILNSLKEKEVLLKEVHHRVKNNLQIIASLMSLESHKHQDIPEVAEAFEQMRSRVRSIALIHEKLYATQTYSEVDMAGYIESLSRSIRDAHARPGQSISLRFELPAVSACLEKALPLGLLANEAVTNAFKHAFAGRETGEVLVRLETGDGQLSLLVEDDGVGMAPEIRQELARGGSRGLGMQLIKTLSDQLGGSISFPVKEKGFSILASFPGATLR